MQNLQQLVPQGRFMMFTDDLVNMTEKRVQAVAFFDGFVDQMHHAPIQLHLLLQVTLQTTHKIIHTLQPPLHLLHLSRPLLNPLLRLHSRLPIMLLVVGLIGFKMEVHLIGSLALPLQYMYPLLIRPISLQTILAVPLGIAVQPLEQHNIIVKFALADLVKGEWLVDLELLQSLLQQSHVAVVVLGVSAREVQLEDVETTGVDRVDDLRISHSITQHLHTAVLGLHLQVYPLEQLVPTHVHHI